MMKRFFFGVLAAVLSVVSAQAGTVLLYDGAPYANKGETGGYTRTNDKVAAYDGVLNQNPTSSLIVGFDTGSGNGWNSHGSSTVYILPSSCNLALPESFTTFGFANKGAAAFGFLRSENTSSIYGMERKLGASLRTEFSNAFAGADAKSYYLRVLMSYDNALSYGSTSHKHALGFNPSAFSSASIGSIPNKSLAIGMSKKTGTVHATLWVAGTEYDLGTELDPATTYIGIVEIAVNGGADGKDRFRAFVAPADDFPKVPQYSATLNGDLGYVDAALEAPQYMFVAGSYGVQSKPVAFDEITIATEYSDVALYVVEGLDCRAPTVENITQTTADVSGRFIYTSLDSATLSVIYGRTEEDLSSEAEIGVKTETGVYGTQLTGLLPATTYYCATKGVFSGEQTSLVTSFTTAGGAAIATPSLTGSVEEGLVAAASIDLGYVDYAAADVELYIGTDPDALSLVKTWEGQTESGTFSFTKTDGIDYGTKFYAQFKVVKTVAAGEERTALSDVVAYTTPANLVWAGAEGGDFMAAASWTPSVSPFIEATVIFNGAAPARALLSADAEVKTIKYDTTADVVLDLGGHTLTVGALTFGDQTSGTLTVTNGTFVLPNGSFSTGKGRTFRIAKGATLKAPILSWRPMRSRCTSTAVGTKRRRQPSTGKSSFQMVAIIVARAETTVLTTLPTARPAMVRKSLSRAARRRILTGSSSAPAASTARD